MLVDHKTWGAGSVLGLAASPTPAAIVVPPQCQGENENGMADLNIF